jgi:hypothetical protein
LSRISVNSAFAGIETPCLLSLVVCAAVPASISTRPSARTIASLPFNAGSLTDSIILAMADYLRIVAPQNCFAFSTPP